MPSRIFTPQVLAPTGAKLSKSLLREHGKAALPADIEPWMLDTTTWSGNVERTSGTRHQNVVTLAGIELAEHHRHDGGHGRAAGGPAAGLPAVRARHLRPWQGPALLG
jgi:hypothetical protein